MRRPVLIFGHDSRMNNSLKDYFDESCNCDTHVCDESSSATAVLKQNGSPTVLLDLRTRWVRDETEQFLSGLAKNTVDKFDLITITDGFYPRELAAPADLLSVGQIDAPVDVARAAQSLEFSPDSRTIDGMRARPDACVAVANDIQLFTHSADYHDVLEQMLRMAPYDVTLLLVGETGTGKTTLAKAIHQLSPRTSEPFHQVACGALPPDLIESELFGHLRGAFTSADRNQLGRFEAAGRGTLLLDEIDVLGTNVQPKLLRVIETGEYEMVGSTETRTSKARLIVASNVDLKQLTEEKKFRSDLYFRLNVLEFRLPPLRERKRDIVPLALQFVDACCKKHGVPIQRIHRDFLAVLKNYHWPGNIRELKNQIQRAVLFCENGDLTANDLPHAICDPMSNSEVAEVSVCASSSLADRVAHSEREILDKALREHGYKRTTTAKSLGISRVGLYKKMKKYGMIEKRQ